MKSLVKSLVSPQITLSALGTPNVRGLNYSQPSTNVKRLYYSQLSTNVRGLNYSQSATSVRRFYYPPASTPKLYCPPGSTNYFLGLRSYCTQSSVPATSNLQREVKPQTTGLKFFLTKIYTNTGLGFAGALGTSLLVSHTLPLSPEMWLGSLIVGLTGSLGSIYFFGRTEPIYSNQTIEWNDQKFTSLVPTYTKGHYLAVATLYGSMGLMMSPIVGFAGPLLVAEAAGLSLAVMGGSSLYAMYAKPGSLLPYRSVAYGALTGLVGIGLISIISSLVLGNGNLFYLLYSIDTYGGLVLFTILNAIETHAAIDLYQKGTPDHLGCSVTLTLNSFNIFIRVLKILMELNQKR